MHSNRIKVSIYLPLFSTYSIHWRLCSNCTRALTFENFLFLWSDWDFFLFFLVRLRLSRSSAMILENLYIDVYIVIVLGHWRLRFFFFGQIEIESLVMQQQTCSPNSVVGVCVCVRVRVCACARVYARVCLCMWYTHTHTHTHTCTHANNTFCTGTSLSLKIKKKKKIRHVTIPENKKKIRHVPIPQNQPRAFISNRRWSRCCGGAFLCLQGICVCIREGVCVYVYVYV